MSTEDNKRVLERFDALLGQSDLAALDELCAPDLVNHTLTRIVRRDFPAPGSSSRPKDETR